MSKLERLNSRVAKILTVAVNEVLEMVKETVTQYQQKTARTQRENERLRLKLREALEKLAKEREEVSRHESLSRSCDCIPLLQRMSVKQNSDFIQDDSQAVKTERDSSHITDPETVCDLSVALTLAGCQKTVSENRPVLNNSTLSLSAPSNIKCNNSTDSLCSVKWTQLTTHEPDTSHADSKPEITTQCIKKESDDADYTSLNTHPQVPQSGYDFAEDLSGTAAREQPTSEISANDSYGQILFHSGYNALGRRLGYGRGVRSTLDAREHKQSAQSEEHHICLVCGKTFSRMGNLRIHQRCHTGEKPYCCLICGRCFSQAGDLKKHKRVHTGEKPYYCTQCGKNFSRGENLKRHQKTHIGETLHLQQS